MLLTILFYKTMQQQEAKEAIKNKVYDFIGFEPVKETGKPGNTVSRNGGEYEYKQGP